MLVLIASYLQKLVCLMKLFCVSEVQMHGKFGP